MWCVVKYVIYCRSMSLEVIIRENGMCCYKGCGNGGKDAHPHLTPTIFILPDPLLGEFTQQSKPTIFLHKLYFVTCKILLDKCEPVC